MSEREFQFRCQKDPEFFIREVLGGDPWPVQVAIAESVRDHDETNVPSCHSSGKSWIAARIVLWFLYSHPGAKVVTTAPTERQVKQILWSEIRSAHRAAPVPMGGRMLSLDLHIDDDWWATGFTAPDYDPNRFQGFHAPHILIVEDEAAGITPAIEEQIESLASGGHARTLRIGNPVEAGSPFQESCESSVGKTIPISAFDTPNFTEPGITEADIISGRWVEKCNPDEPVLPHLISPKWVSQRMERWGTESNRWRSRVKGLFPEVAEGSYFGELMKKLKDQGRFCPVPYDPNFPLVTAWDIGRRDSTTIWFAQPAGREVRLVNYFEDSGMSMGYYLDKLEEYQRDLGYRYSEHLGPHDMNVEEWQVDGTRAQNAAKRGFHFRTIPNTPKQDQLEAVRSMLPRCVFDTDRTRHGRSCLVNYRREKNPRTGEWKPDAVHDWASHGADAFMQLALGLRSVAKQVSRPKPNVAWVT